MLNDRVSRLNPETGAFVEYLLPRETNIRPVFVDNARRRWRSGSATITRGPSSRSSRWSDWDTGRAGVDLSDYLCGLCGCQGRPDVT
jgi:hypothetical protein